MSKDHGSDCESSTFTTRPGSFPDKIIVGIWKKMNPKGKIKSILYFKFTPDKIRTAT